MNVFEFSATDFIAAFAVFLPIVIFYRYQTGNDDYWKKRRMPYEPRPAWYSLVYVLFTKNLHELEKEQYQKHERIYGYQTKNDDYWKKRGVPYEPRPAWYYLVYVLFTKKLHALEMEQYQKHGRIYGGFEGRKPNLTIADPDLLRDILVKDFQSFSCRREFDLSSDPIFSNMLFGLNGETWKRVRTIITPAFTSRKMRKMTDIINDCSQTVIKTFLNKSMGGTAVDLKRTFGAYTIDVIASSAFATKINSHEDPNNPFVIHAYNSFNKNALLRVLAFVLIPQIFWKILRLKIINSGSVTFFRNVTLQVIEERRKKGQRGNDFLQLMMDAYKEQLEAEGKADGFKMLDLDEDEKDLYGEAEINKQVFKAVYQNRNLSQDELLAQCVLFFMVGYETTASTLSFLTYSLACNPEVQEKLIQEVDEAFKGIKELTYDIVRDMKYLDCVVSETLRMYPPLLRAERTAVEDYKLNYKGLTIEKGTIVGFPIYAMHHDPEFYPDPEKFMPERFSTENMNHPTYAYLPFGAGPRNCLGMRFALMEIKLCIANALHRLRFKTCSETKIPIEFAMAQGFLSPKSMMLTVEERKDVS